MEENLLDWYEQINEEAGELAKVVVPVLNTEPEQEPKVLVPTKPADPVEEKDKGNSLVSFVMAKRIQDLLVKIAGLSSPYEADSEERQQLSDKLKEIYRQLGDNIGKL